MRFTVWPRERKTDAIPSRQKNRHRRHPRHHQNHHPPSHRRHPLVHAAKADRLPVHDAASLVAPPLLDSPAPALLGEGGRGGAYSWTISTTQRVSFGTR